MVLVDSLIFAGVLPGCGTAMMTIADMSGPVLHPSTTLVVIAPAMAVSDLSTSPILPGDEPCEEQGSAACAPAPGEEVAAGSWGAAPLLEQTGDPPVGGPDDPAWGMSVDPPQSPVPDDVEKPPTLSVQPMWDKPILAALAHPAGPVEKSVTSPLGEVQATITELVAKLGVPAPVRTTLFHAPGDTAGLVALYSTNTREVLVVDPLDPEGRVLPEALVLFDDLLRSPKTGATHETSPALVRLLYAVALAHDRVLMISSSYRQPGAGTKPTSYHTQGMAADVKHPYLPAKSIVDFAREWGAGGIGYYPKTRFVHLDVRDEPYFWVDYSGPGEHGPVLADPHGTLAAEAACIWEPDTWPALEAFESEPS